MTTRRLVISRSAALVGAASTGLLLPSIVRAQSGKVRVGFMLPYTGTFAQLGVAIENGVRLAIDLLGHGDADKPHDPEAYEQLEALVAAQLPDEPVDIIGFSLGAATRGLVVGMVTALCVMPFARLEVANLGLILWFGLLACFIMGMLGVFAGLWAQKFDQLAAVQNFVIMPMTFLSGTFYLVDNLPEPFATISHFNPIFYMIDGFRYGFFAQSDVSPWISLAVVAGAFAVTCGIALALLSRGFKLRN